MLIIPQCNRDKCWFVPDCTVDPILTFSDDRCWFVPDCTVDPILTFSNDHKCWFVPDSRVAPFLSYSGDQCWSYLDFLIWSFAKSLFVPDCTVVQLILCKLSHFIVLLRVQWIFRKRGLFLFLRWYHWKTLKSNFLWAVWDLNHVIMTATLLLYDIIRNHSRVW